MNLTSKNSLVFICLLHFIFITSLKAVNTSKKNHNHHRISFQSMKDSWPLYKSAFNWYTLYGNDYNNEKSLRKDFYRAMHNHHKKYNRNQYKILRKAYELLRDDWNLKNLMKIQNDWPKQKSKNRKVIPFKYG